VAREYVFVDEWDVDAPQDVVYDIVADARTYPEWWRPVYLSVEGDEKVTRHRFKGRLPYTLKMRAEMVREDRPRQFEVSVDGDLRGRGIWTFTPAGNGGTHVRWDWIVFADRPLLRYLTPVLRPLFRWNHAWAVARAREQLEPYARARAGR
jgi:Polyketide cyclase / dehydrase and lipid transport